MFITQDEHVLTYPDGRTSTRGSKNPFTSSSLGGRLLSGVQLPFFLLRPPAGYGVLTTIGRTTGKRRSRCIRLVQRGDEACIVSIHGPSVGWLRNLTEQPTIRVRTAAGWRQATAVVGLDAVSPELRDAYVNDVGWFCNPEYLMWRKGRPTRDRIRSLHRSWLETGTPVALKIENDAAGSLRSRAWSR